MLVLRRFLIALAAVLLVWRIATTGLSAHYVEHLRAGDRDAASKALAWNSRQPDALLHQAVAAREQDPKSAADLLARAHGENPSDPRPVMIMADIAQAQGNQARSEALVTAAVNLVPSDPWIQKRAAVYWSIREDLDRALRHWSLALDADPGYKEQLFPVLLDLAEDPRTRAGFKPFAQSPPSWWEGFFKEAATKAVNLDTVRALYAFRKASTQTPITQVERQAFVTRLKKDGSTAEAYIHWINGLTREERARLGLLFDGSFELDPSNWGFGWRMRSTPTALVYRANTYGVDGDTALHLLFKNHSKWFRGISQALFLAPGPYRLSGKVRTDSLKTEGGLKWLVRCLLPEEEDLGESNRVLGTNEWRDFEFEFAVPASCGLQEIRLVSAGRRAFEHKITGDAWFDRIAIRKIEKLTRAPNLEPQGAVTSTADGAGPNASQEAQTDR